MANFLKAVFHRPFTRAELQKECGGMLSNPPLPAEMLEAAINCRSKNDVSLLDGWRQSYLKHLDEISEATTWKLQRAILFRIVLKSSSYIALYSAACNVKHLKSWTHIVEGNGYFSNFPHDKWDSILTQLHTTNILTYACLLATGHKLYNIDSEKQFEIECFQEYEKSIRGLDIAVNDIMNTCIEEDDPEQALAVMDLKEEVINDMINDEFKVLNLMEEQIINGSLNLKQVKEKMQGIEVKKSELAKLVQANAVLA